MPRPLIAKLRELCSLKIVVRDTEGKKDNLSDVRTPVDEKTSETIEEIERLSLELFGPNKEPTRREKVVMEKLGFKVSPVEVDIVGWKKAQIETPVGTITF